MVEEVRLKSRWNGETCKKCGREQRFAWCLKHDLWDKLAGKKWKNKVLCIDCFLKMVSPSIRLTINDFLHLGFVTGTYYKNSQRARLK